MGRFDPDIVIKEVDYWSLVIVMIDNTKVIMVRKTVNLMSTCYDIMNMSVLGHRWGAVLSPFSICSSTHSHEMLMLIWIAFGILLFHKKWLVWCLVFCV